MTTLEELFIVKLEELLSTERVVAKALPRLVKYAHDSELKERITTHVKETEIQITRVEEIFYHMESPARPRRTEAIEALFQDARLAQKEKGDPSVIEALLLSDLALIESYEVSRYRTLQAWAEILGFTVCRELIETSLREEERMLEKALKCLEVFENEEVLVKTDITDPRSSP